MCGEGPLLAQPFVRGVAEEGEFSLFYFNGRHSHTLLKVPARTDFRVQSQYGGRFATVTATEELRRAGSLALEALMPEVPLYARVDLVRADGGEGYWLMELELIEPRLYLDTCPEAPARFARAVAECIDGTR